MAMLRGGAFPVDDAVTHIVGIEDAGQALHEWSANPATVTRIHVDLA
jgi:threonine dehydrogenase-like Zn-dependent dehydrogenase